MDHVLESPAQSNIEYWKYAQCAKCKYVLYTENKKENVTMSNLQRTIKIIKNIQRKSCRTSRN